MSTPPFDDRVRDFEMVGTEARLVDDIECASIACQVSDFGAYDLTKFLA
jgi:hypothetical protein